MNKNLLTPTLLATTAVLWALAGTAGAQRVFLLVDRDSGELSAVSSSAVEVDGYSIFSDAGRLDPTTWTSLNDQSVPGWVEANPRDVQLSELNWTGASSIGSEPVSLGPAYNGSGVPPTEEDLEFQYSSPAGTVLGGSVHYMGAPQVPQISVDRSNGEIQVLNPLSFEITGYTILSSAGSLLPDSFNGLEDQNADGWREANPTTNRLSEVSLENSRVVDGAGFSVGNGFAPGSPEDLTFEYVLTDGTISSGLVRYEGAPNDLTLEVDVLSGAARIVNPSAAAGTFDLFGYSITSASGGLSVENWTSFADTGDAGANWTEANPRADSLAELNVASSVVFDGGKSISLGDIFVGDATDLAFEYSTEAGPANGTVHYVLNLGDGTLTCEQVAASRLIEGDLNGDNTVDFGDFITLSTNFGQVVDSYEQGDVNCGGDVDFADFITLSTNFGMTAEAVASVPEPSTMLLVLGILPLLTFRKRR